MTPRPPADAVVALRGLERRYRGLFAGLEDDESPEDLAHRNGADGRSALDHVAAASRTLSFLGRGVEQALVEDALAELGRAAGALADRVGHVSAADWDRHVRVAGRDATTTPLAVLWDAVDSAITHLKQAQQTLAQVRGR